MIFLTCADTEPDLEAGQPADADADAEAMLEHEAADVQGEAADTGLEGEESVLDAAAEQSGPTAAEVVKAESEGEAAADQLLEHAAPVLQKVGQDSTAAAVSGWRDAVQQELLTDGEASMKRMLSDGAAEAPSKRIKGESEGPFVAD